MANCIGPYELIAELGSGAMGKVYRARDTRLDREVALKVLWPQLAEQPAAVARFEREARAVARLQHPNVVAIYDVGAVAGYYYLAMEYVAGCSLRDLLHRPLPVGKAIACFKQILSGLGVAHEQGVIHRDLKPGNILIETATETVKLADFGLARIVEEEVSLTQSGEMLGTIEYMAPELGRGEGASRQSDLYAAGVVLYRLLAGRFPFQGATPLAMMRAHKCGTYPPASTIAPGLPPQADGVLARLLACEPANRYADCQAVFADLERWARGEAIPREFAAAYEPIDHELERHRVPGWKRAWVRVATWYGYQWLEAFDRTELTAIRVRDEVQAAETEVGKARRRLEEATLLRNRVRSRADEARAAAREGENAAEKAYAAGDETQVRQRLAAKLEAKERAEELEKEAARSEEVMTQARQEYEGKAAHIAELRHGADLLLARRRRAKLEMSVLGILPAGGRRIGERCLAAGKLLGPIVVLVAGICWWPEHTPSEAILATPPSLDPREEEAANQAMAAKPPIEYADEPTEEYNWEEAPLYGRSDAEYAALSMEQVMKGLILYQSFDGTVSAERISFNPTYTNGLIGRDLSQALVIPDGGRCDYRLPRSLLKEGTIIAYVQLPNQGRSVTFWQFDQGYPCAEYNSNTNKSRFRFSATESADRPAWDQPQNRVIGNQHYAITDYPGWDGDGGIVQSWGPAGYNVYRKTYHSYRNPDQRSGIPVNLRYPGSGQQDIYLYIGNDENRRGGSIIIDELMVFNRQLSPIEISYLDDQAIRGNVATYQRSQK